MGAIADGFMAFAKPLLEKTDGSLEEMNKSLSIAQLCFNLALMPEEHRDKTLREMQSSIGMGDEEFEVFTSSVIVPMIRRHHEMFPRMHQRGSASVQSAPSPRVYPKIAVPAEKGAVADRYAPCPCNSGKKYKFCCGETGR